jgi:hypothetical protein
MVTGLFLFYYLHIESLIVRNDDIFTRLNKTKIRLTVGIYFLKAWLLNSALLKLNEG